MSVGNYLESRFLNQFSDDRIISTKPTDENGYHVHCQDSVPRELLNFVQANDNLWIFDILEIDFSNVENHIQMKIDWADKVEQ